jgi:hypothetical protein
MPQGKSMLRSLDKTLEQDPEVSVLFPPHLSNQNHLHLDVKLPIKLRLAPVMSFSRTLIM